MLEGWLLDCYPSSNGGMTFWIKRRSDGRLVKLHDNAWRNRIYATTTDNPEYVSSRIAKCSQNVSSVKYAYKRADIMREGVQKVLEIELARPDKARQVAETLESTFKNPLSFKLYNVDVLPEQTYFYDKAIFPLGLVRVETSDDEITSWEMHDDVELVDYTLPELKVLSLDIAISSKVSTFDSRLTGIRIQDKKDVMKFEGSEREILERAHEELVRSDPDIVVTRNGDLFALPYLYSKAQLLGVDFNLNRDREMRPSHLSLIQTKGNTFFSYGRILFKAKMQKLYGRVHLDEANTFVFDQCRFAGLFEITRLCRMPLQNSVRASIGKCLSSLQFYYATKRDILIPWKPWIAEDPKTFRELLRQDRGGMILDPLPGIHEHVAEIDFASLYPSIIRKYNISAETLNCDCCNETGYKIEGLDLHICRLKDGIVAESLKLPLEKRFRYKDMRDETKDKMLKQIYNERAGSLKWILVTCLAKESSVLIKRNNTVEYVKIGEFIDGIACDKEGIIDCPGDIFVAGIGNDMKSKFCKVKKLVRIPNHQKLLRVTLDDGRKILATPDHPAYLLKNGNLEVRRTSDLKEGDFLPYKMAQTTNTITTSKYGESILSFANVKGISEGDLGFAMIRKIQELDRVDTYVYCFQLEDYEVPGFFTGGGAIFTHNCFGYLSYRNAKFGKIDSHIAVCGYARKTLLRAMRIAEERGHRVLHGIVDSLWLAKNDATREEYLELCDKIKQETGFKIVLEGIYKWIVFLTSKTSSVNQVANRYFGCFEGTNELKVRGIELRRRDAPAYFQECQSEILKILSECDNAVELEKKARTDGVQVFNEFAIKLERHEVPASDLLITRRLSKNLEEYHSQRQLSVSASSKLERMGLKLQAGQSVSYVVTKYKTSGRNRAVPEELLEDSTYDCERYVELLADCCATILTPFGVSKKLLLTRSRTLEN